jgi:hypothetical protein
VSWEIVGVEGIVPDDAPVAWGAAAVSDGERLYNNFTGVSTPLADLTRLRDEKHLHVFKKPLAITDDDALDELIVLMVNRRTDFEDSLRPDPGRLGGVVTHAHSKAWRYYVFSGRDAFNVYATVAAHTVIEQVLYAGPPRTAHNRDLVRIALTLAPGHPELNALRAYLDERPNVERLARASVRPATSMQAFDLLLAAMRSEAEDYELKYEHGAAEGGGFDVDIAITTLRAIESANDEFSPFLQRNYPFIKAVPPPRLREMLAASAELHFVPNIQGRPLGERVARYLAIYFLQQSLSGNKPPEVALSEQLHQALRTIARPTESTTLQQKKLSEVEREDVHQPEQHVAESTFSEELRVLGIVSGLTQDSRAELWIGPERRFFVSTTDDGQGQAPIGAEAIRGDGRFLRRPCIFVLVRESIESGSEQFHLRSMAVLQLGDTSEVTAVPSGVLPGAFVVGLTLDIEYREDASIVTPIGIFADVTDGTLATAKRWLTDYRAACNEFEITEDPAHLQWLPPSKKEKATSLQRVMVILHELRGAGLATDVVAGINERFDAIVRVNNTRREVGHHPDLLQYTDDAQKILALTPRGAAYIAAYIAAGGATRAL